MDASADTSAFLGAAGKGDEETVSSLLAQGVDVNAREESGRGRTALMRACRHGQVRVAELLLSYGAEVDSQDLHGDTALAYAGSNGYPELVTLLLEQGADPELKNKAGRTVLEEIGQELLGTPGMTDEEVIEAQKLFWHILSLCRKHARP